MPYSVREVCDWFDGTWVNSQDLGALGDRIAVERPAMIRRSEASDLVFFFSVYYKEQLLEAAPGILVTGEEFVGPLKASGIPLWKKTAIISVKDPYLAMAIASEKFADRLSSVAHINVDGRETQIHPSAAIHESAKIGRGVRVDAHVTVERGAVIGDGCILYPGTYVGPESQLGKNCVLFPNVTLYERTILGERVRIHSGSVIGADGFGYSPVKNSKGEITSHQKIYHLGSVILGNDVEIGANTCIDRGTYEDTVVGDGTKIDNQVQIGHNGKIGKNTIICGQAGLAGSVTIGDQVYFGGASVAGNKVVVGDGARVGGVTFLSKSVEPGKTVLGYPAKEPMEFHRLQALLNRMLRDGQKKQKKMKDVNA